MCEMSGVAGTCGELLDPVGNLEDDESQLRRTVLTAALSSFCLGYNTGVIAGAQLRMDKDPTVAPLDSSIRGALVSCVLAGAMVGAACGGVADRVGRRRAMLAVTTIFVLGPAAMAAAPNMLMLILARTVVGISVGVSSGLANLYISEIAPAQSRGRLGGWAPFLGTTGILVSYIISACLSVLSYRFWRLLLGLAMVPAVAQLFLQRLLPETPRWLLSNGRRLEAGESLSRLFPAAGANLINTELDRVQAELDCSRTGLKVGVRVLLRNHRKPSFLGIFINVLQQVSGINVVIYFGPTILTDSGFGDTGAMVATAMVSVMQLVATAVLIGLVDRIGRRPMALAGILLMLGGLGIIIFSFLGQQSNLTSWLAVLGMLVFRGAFSMSLGPLPYIMTSEFFQQEARAAGVALSWAANWGSNFVVALTFPIVVKASRHEFGYRNGIAYILSIYAFFCVIAFVFVLWMLPETRGLSLETAMSCGGEVTSETDTQSERFGGG